MRAIRRPLCLSRPKRLTTEDPATPSLHQGALRAVLNNRLGPILLICVGLGVGAVVGELACQVYSLFLFRGWDRTLASPFHYYRRSANSVLAYELVPGFSAEVEGRRLLIDSCGFRAGPVGTGPRLMAVLGDSVVFGVGLDEKDTLPASLERQLATQGVPTRVVNVGVAGYGLEQLPQLLNRAMRCYDVNDVIYVLNLNDFALRETVYEGADNGLYRLYVRPGWKLPWMLRKAVYRMRKRGSAPTVAWYRWLYEGTRARHLPSVLALRELARAKGASFTTVILPAGVAYATGGYRLRTVHEDIGGYLAEHQVRFCDLMYPLADAPVRWFDSTDHLTPEGSRKVATVLSAYLGAQRLATRRP